MTKITTDPGPISEEIKAEVRHNSQLLNILSYWLKKSLTGTKGRLREALSITRIYLGRANKKLETLLRKKV